MAVIDEIIDMVRYYNEDGDFIEKPWDPNASYEVRDDDACLYFRTTVEIARPATSEKGTYQGFIEQIPDSTVIGKYWQKWDFKKDISAKRRHGEISLRLDCPRNYILRCYVIPVQLLNLRQVSEMLSEIENELGPEVAWDTLGSGRDRSWSKTLVGATSTIPAELIKNVKEEIQVARWIRRMPFEELASPSLEDSILAENAFVSHWATRRYAQVHDLVEVVVCALNCAEARRRRPNPQGRLSKVIQEADRLSKLMDDLNSLKNQLPHFVKEAELATPMYFSPLFQRDHRLRCLLRSYARVDRETASAEASQRSLYPLRFLNDLWELWGAVWLVQQLRRLGFEGMPTVEWVSSVTRCSWSLTKGEILIELDFEAHPALADYPSIPPVYDREGSFIDWLAANQELDIKRPYFGLEGTCSPDYLIRVTTPQQKQLIVGDASLASAAHHSSGSSKLNKVEKYRKTIIWSADGVPIGCHFLGGFVIYPPPTSVWSELECPAGAPDCTILCPQPGGDCEANDRFTLMLTRVVPEIRASIGLRQ